MRTNIFKVVSIVLSIIISSQNVSFAGVANVQNVPQTPNGLDKIYIPESYGKIEKTMDYGPWTMGSKSPQVILVKDAHCNYEAQKNIAKILEVLARDYKVDLVAVEGAAGDVSLERFGKLGNDKTKEKATDIYVKKGIVTGPEYLRITKYNELPFGIYGIEDGELYVKNFMSFRNTISNAKETQFFIDELSKTVKTLKQKIYPKELLEFDNQICSYNSSELSLSDYVKVLYKKGDINKNEYSNLVTVYHSILIEEGMDFKKVEREREQLIRYIEKDLPKEELEQFVKNSLQYKLGKISSVDYYAFLNKFTVNCKLSTVNLRGYIRLVKLQARIDSDKLFKEIDALENSIKTRLFCNNIERSLDALSKNINILSKLFNLQLDREGLQYFKDHKNEFSAMSLLSLIKVQAPLNNIQIPSLFNDDNFLKKIDEYIVPGDRFYEEAVLRDKALVDNTLEKMDKEKKQTAVMIAGGFHADGITKLLQDKNVSYVVITPKITKVQEDCPYLSLMMDERIKIPAAVSNGQNLAVPDMVGQPQGINEIAVKLGMERLCVEAQNELARLIMSGEKISETKIEELGLTEEEVQRFKSVMAEIRKRKAGGTVTTAGDVLAIIIKVGSGKSAEESPDVKRDRDSLIGDILTLGSAIQGVFRQRGYVSSSSPYYTEIRVDDFILADGARHSISYRLNDEGVIAVFIDGKDVVYMEVDTEQLEKLISDVSARKPATREEAIKIFSARFGISGQDTEKLLNSGYIGRIVSGEMRVSKPYFYPKDARIPRDEYDGLYRKIAEIISGLDIDEVVREACKLLSLLKTLPSEESKGGRALGHNLSNSKANQIIEAAEDKKDIKGQDGEVGLEAIKSRLRDLTVSEQELENFERVCNLAGFTLADDNVKLIIVDTDKEEGFELHYGNIKNYGAMIKIFARRDLLTREGIGFDLAHEFIEGHKLRELVKAKMQAGEKFIDTYIRLEKSGEMNRLEDEAHKVTDDFINLVKAIDFINNNLSERGRIKYEKVLKNIFKSEYFARMISELSDQNNDNHDVGGLPHTMRVCEVIIERIKKRPGIFTHTDTDLVILAAFLHDIGKVDTYTLNAKSKEFKIGEEMKTSFDKTKEEITGEIRPLEASFEIAGREVKKKVLYSFKELGIDANGNLVLGKTPARINNKALKVINVSYDTVNRILSIETDQGILKFEDIKFAYPNHESRSAEIAKELGLSDPLLLDLIRCHGRLISVLDEQMDPEKRGKMKTDRCNFLSQEGVETSLDILFELVRADYLSMADMDETGKKVPRIDSESLKEKTAQAVEELGKRYMPVVEISMPAFGAKISRILEDDITDLNKLERLQRYLLEYLRKLGLGDEGLVKSISDAGQELVSKIERGERASKLDWIYFLLFSTQDESHTADIRVIKAVYSEIKNLLIPYEWAQGLENEISKAEFDNLESPFLIQRFFISRLIDSSNPGIRALLNLTAPVDDMQGYEGLLAKNISIISRLIGADAQTIQNLQEEALREWIALAGDRYKNVVNALSDSVPIEQRIFLITLPPYVIQQLDNLLSSYKQDAGKILTAIFNLSGNHSEFENQIRYIDKLHQSADNLDKTGHLQKILKNIGMNFPGLLELIQRLSQKSGSLNFTKKQIKAIYDSIVGGNINQVEGFIWELEVMAKKVEITKGMWIGEMVQRRGTKNIKESKEVDIMDTENGILYEIKNKIGWLFIVQQFFGIDVDAKKGVFRSKKAGVSHADIINSAGLIQVDSEGRPIEGGLTSDTQISEIIYEAKYEDETSTFIKDLEQYSASGILKRITNPDGSVTYIISGDTFLKMVEDNIEKAYREQYHRSVRADLDRETWDIELGLDSETLERVFDTLGIKNRADRIMATLLLKKAQKEGEDISTQGNAVNYLNLYVRDNQIILPYTKEYISKVENALDVLKASNGYKAFRGALENRSINVRINIQNPEIDSQPVKKTVEVEISAKTMLARYLDKDNEILKAAEFLGLKEKELDMSGLTLEKVIRAVDKRFKDFFMGMEYKDGTLIYNGTPVSLQDAGELKIFIENKIQVRLTKEELDSIVLIIMSLNRPFFYCTYNEMIDRANKIEPGKMQSIKDKINSILTDVKSPLARYELLEKLVLDEGYADVIAVLFSISRERTDSIRSKDAVERYWAAKEKKDKGETLTSEENELVTAVEHKIREVQIVMSDKNPYTQWAKLILTHSDNPALFEAAQFIMTFDISQDESRENTERMINTILEDFFNTLPEGTFSEEGKRLFITEFFNQINDYYRLLHLSSEGKLFGESHARHPMLMFLTADINGCLMSQYDQYTLSYKRKMELRQMPPDMRKKEIIQALHDELLDDLIPVIERMEDSMLENLLADKASHYTLLKYIEQNNPELSNELKDKPYFALLPVITGRIFGFQRGLSWKDSLMGASNAFFTYMGRTLTEFYGSILIRIPQDVLARDSRCYYFTEDRIWGLPKYRMTSKGAPAEFVPWSEKHAEVMNMHDARLYQTARAMVDIMKANLSLNTNSLQNIVQQRASRHAIRDFLRRVSGAVTSIELGGTPEGHFYKPVNLEEEDIVFAVTKDVGHSAKQNHSAVASLLEFGIKKELIRYIRKLNKSGKKIKEIIINGNTIFSAETDYDDAKSGALLKLLNMENILKNFKGGAAVIINYSDGSIQSENIPELNAGIVQDDQLSRIRRFVVFRNKFSESSIKEGKTGRDVLLEEYLDFVRTTAVQADTVIGLLFNVDKEGIVIHSCNELTGVHEYVINKEGLEPEQLIDVLLETREGDSELIEILKKIKIEKGRIIAEGITYLESNRFMQELLDMANLYTIGSRFRDTLLNLSDITSDNINFIAKDSEEAAKLREDPASAFRHIIDALNKAGILKLIFPEVNINNELLMNLKFVYSLNAYFGKSAPLNIIAVSILLNNLTEKWNTPEKKKELAKKWGIKDELLDLVTSLNLDISAIQKLAVFGKLFPHISQKLLGELRIDIKSYFTAVLFSAANIPQANYTVFLQNLGIKDDAKIRNIINIITDTGFKKVIDSEIRERTEETPELSEEIVVKEGVEELYELGDLHGEFNKLVSSLTSSGLIDGDGNWIADPGTHFVQVGDFIDIKLDQSLADIADLRAFIDKFGEIYGDGLAKELEAKLVEMCGPEIDIMKDKVLIGGNPVSVQMRLFNIASAFLSFKTMEFLMNIQAQAEQKGCKVIVFMGNHELDLLAFRENDWEYYPLQKYYLLRLMGLNGGYQRDKKEVTIKNKTVETNEITLSGEIDDVMKKITGGIGTARQVQNKYIQWLINLPLAAKINNRFIIHGGPVRSTVNELKDAGVTDIASLNAYLKKKKEAGFRDPFFKDGKSLFAPDTLSEGGKFSFNEETTLAFLLITNSDYLDVGHDPFLGWNSKTVDLSDPENINLYTNILRIGGNSNILKLDFDAKRSDAPKIMHITQKKTGSVIEIINVLTRERVSLLKSGESLDTPYFSTRRIQNAVKELNDILKRAIAKAKEVNKPLEAQVTAKPATIDDAKKAFAILGGNPDIIGMIKAKAIEAYFKGEEGAEERLTNAIDGMFNNIDKNLRLRALVPLDKESETKALLLQSLGLVTEKKETTPVISKPATIDDAKKALASLGGNPEIIGMIKAKAIEAYFKGDEGAEENLTRTIDGMFNAIDKNKKLRELVPQGKEAETKALLLQSLGLVAEKKETTPPIIAQPAEEPEQKKVVTETVETAKRRKQELISSAYSNDDYRKMLSRMKQTGRMLQDDELEDLELVKLNSRRNIYVIQINDIIDSANSLGRELTDYGLIQVKKLTGNILIADNMILLRKRILSNESGLRTQGEKTSKDVRFLISALNGCKTKSILITSDPVGFKKGLIVSQEIDKGIYLMRYTDGKEIIMLDIAQAEIQKMALETITDLVMKLINSGIISPEEISNSNIFYSVPKTTDFYLAMYVLKNIQRFKTDSPEYDKDAAETIRNIAQISNFLYYLNAAGENITYRESVFKIIAIQYIILSMTHKGMPISDIFSAIKTLLGRNIEKFDDIPENLKQSYRDQVSFINASKKRAQDLLKRGRIKPQGRAVTVSASGDYIHNTAIYDIILDMSRESEPFHNAQVVVKNTPIAGDKKITFYYGVRKQNTEVSFIPLRGQGCLLQKQLLERLNNLEIKYRIKARIREMESKNLLYNRQEIEDIVYFEVMTNPWTGDPRAIITSPIDGFTLIPIDGIVREVNSILETQKHELTGSIVAEKELIRDRERQLLLSIRMAGTAEDKLTSLRFASEYYSSKILNQLLIMAKDKSSRVRETAVKGISRIVTGNTKYLIDTERIDCREAINTLCNMLGDPDIRVRWFSALALKFILQNIVIKENIASVNNSIIDYNAILGKIRELLSSNKEKNFIAAATVLQGMSANSNFKEEHISGIKSSLRNIINDRSQKTVLRAIAISALGRFKDPQDVTLLLSCMDDEVTAVRETALNILLNYGMDYAIRAAEKGVNDSDEYLRMISNNYLKKAGRIGIIPGPSDRETHEKFIGAIIGASIGDAIGAPFEGMSSEDIEKQFDIDQVRRAGYMPNRYRNRLPWEEELPQGSGTDDTMMTVAIAQSIIGEGEFIPLHASEMLANEIVNMDVEGRRNLGISLYDILISVRDIYAGKNWRFGRDASKSYRGNGAAIRVSPLGLLYHDDFETLAKRIHDSAVMTSLNIESTAAAIAQGYVIARALTLPKVLTLQDKKKLIIDTINFVSQFKELEGTDLIRNLGLLLFILDEEYLSATPEEEVLRNLRDTLNIHDPSSSVPIAIFLFLYSPNDFQKTVFNAAVKIGVDTDSIASMAGAISGAYNGINGVPKIWLEGLREGKGIAVIVDGLFDTYMQKRAKETPPMQGIGIQQPEDDQSRIKAYLQGVLEKIGSPKAIPEEFFERMVNTPQGGTSHNEGMALANHLYLMHKILNDPRMQESLPPEIQQILQNPLNRQIFELFILFHDIGKVDTVKANLLDLQTFIALLQEKGMSPETFTFGSFSEDYTYAQYLKLSDKDRKKVTFVKLTVEQWKQIFGDIDKDTIFTKYVKTISYPNHAEDSINKIRQFGISIDPEVLNLVRHHMAYAEFAKINPSRIADLAKSGVNIPLLLAASYLDSVSSIKKDGTVDIGPANNMRESYMQYLLTVPEDDVPKVYEEMIKKIKRQKEIERQREIELQRRISELKFTKEELTNLGIPDGIADKILEEQGKGTVVADCKFLNGLEGFPKKSIGKLMELARHKAEEQMQESSKLENILKTAEFTAPSGIPIQLDSLESGIVMLDVGRNMAGNDSAAILDHHQFGSERVTSAAGLCVDEQEKIKALRGKFKKIIVHEDPDTDAIMAVYLVSRLLVGELTQNEIALARYVERYDNALTDYDIGIEQLTESAAILLMGLLKSVKNDYMNSDAMKAKGIKPWEVWKLSQEEKTVLYKEILRIGIRFIELLIKEDFNVKQEKGLLVRESIKSDELRGLYDMAREAVRVDIEIYQREYASAKVIDGVKVINKNSNSQTTIRVCFSKNTKSDGFFDYLYSMGIGAGAIYKDAENGNRVVIAVNPNSNISLENLQKRLNDAAVKRAQELGIPLAKDRQGNPELNYYKLVSNGTLIITTSGTIFTEDELIGLLRADTEESPNISKTREERDHSIDNKSLEDRHLNRETLFIKDGKVFEIVFEKPGKPSIDANGYVLKEVKDSEYSDLAKKWYKLWNGLIKWRLFRKRLIYSLFDELGIKDKKDKKNIRDVLKNKGLTLVIVNGCITLGDLGDIYVHAGRSRIQMTIGEYLLKQLVKRSDKDIQDVMLEELKHIIRDVYNNMKGLDRSVGQRHVGTLLEQREGKGIYHKTAVLGMLEEDEKSAGEEYRKWIQKENGLLDVLKPIELENALSASGLLLEWQKKISENSRGMMTIYDFLTNFSFENGAYALGLGEWILFSPICDATGLTPWAIAYDELFGWRSPGWVNEFMDFITSTDKPIIFFVPRDISSHHETILEIEWLLRNPELMGNVYFVFGAYDFFSDKDVKEVYTGRGGKRISRELIKFFKTFRRGLKYPDQFVLREMKSQHVRKHLGYVQDFIRILESLEKGSVTVQYGYSVDTYHFTLGDIKYEVEINTTEGRIDIITSENGKVKRQLSLSQEVNSHVYEDYSKPIKDLLDSKVDILSGKEIPSAAVGQDNIAELAPLLGLTRGELEGSIKEDTKKLAGALVKILKADGKIEEEEIELIVKQADKVEGIFRQNKIPDAPENAQMKEKIAMFLAIRELERLEGLQNPIEQELETLKKMLKEKHVADESMIIELVDELYNYNRYDDYFRFMMDGIRTLFGITKEDEVDKSLKKLDTYVRVKSAFGIDQGEPVTNSDKIIDVVSRYLEMNRLRTKDKDGTEALLPKIAWILTEYLNNPDSLESILSSIKGDNANKRKESVQKGLESLIGRRGLRIESSSKKLENMPNNRIERAKEGYRRAGVWVDEKWRGQGGSPGTWQEGVLPIIEAKLLVCEDNGEYRIAPSAEETIWLLRKTQTNLRILYSTEAEKEAVMALLKLHGIVLNDENFITEYPSVTEEREERVVAMLTAETVKNLKGKIPKNHSVVQGREDGENDLMLMSRMAWILGSVKEITEMNDLMTKLFLAYYGVKDVEDLNKDAKKVLEDILEDIKGGSLTALILSLPPIAPFVKAYYKVLKLSKETIGKAA